MYSEYDVIASEAFRICVSLFTKNHQYFGPSATIHLHHTCNKWLVCNDLNLRSCNEEMKQMEFWNKFKILHLNDVYRYFFAINVWCWRDSRHSYKNTPLVKIRNGIWCNSFNCSHSKYEEKIFLQLKIWVYQQRWHFQASSVGCGWLRQVSIIEKLCKKPGSPVPKLTTIDPGCVCYGCDWMYAQQVQEV